MFHSVRAGCYGRDAEGRLTVAKKRLGPVGLARMLHDGYYAIELRGLSVTRPSFDSVNKKNRERLLGIARYVLRKMRESEG